MRANIITRPWTNPERILPRLGNLLSERTGWPVRRAPGKGCELAYFLPYLEMPADAPRPTCKTAAWFTHRDTSLEGKVDEWERVASAVDLRLTSARMYLPELEQYGPTALVTPPLDREAFTIAPRVEHDRPLIGTTGYSYPGGRKGEELLAQLRAHLGKSAQVVATGRGWPTVTRTLPWAEMPEFYQSLDLYVCTSTIEGVGYGPLEALACGVGVVVPEGVGVFDELPDLPGIYRYRARDVVGLVRNVERALADRGHWDPDALRQTTERFTADAWVADHLAAFEALLGDSLEAVQTPVLEVPPDWRGHSGCYVVAFGEPARRCAVRAITSFKRHMPGVPVALCSDRPLGPEDVLIVEAEADIGCRSHKLRVYDLAPPEWHYVLYLDADTETVAPVPALFEWLADGYELVICKNPGKFHLAANMGRKDNQAETEATFTLYGSDQMLQLNGGVFAFRRSPRTAHFFSEWHREWNRASGRDQGALLRVLWRYPLRLWVLGNEWNTVAAYDPPERSAGIVHHVMDARRWEGPIYGRTDGEEAWARVRAWEKAHLAGASR